MANFNLYVPKLEHAEGGWSDHPNDTPTNKGITLATYKKYGHDLNNDGVINKADLKKLTRTIALDIYKQEYWNRVKGDSILDQDVAETFMDMAVNAGISRATIIMQRELNSQGHVLKIDGAMGPKTLAAINHSTTNSDQLFNDYNNAREDFYQGLADNNAKYKPFLKGWLVRVARFGRKTVNQAVYIAENITPTLGADGKKKV